MSISDLVAQFSLKVDQRGFKEVNEGFKKIHETVMHVAEGLAIFEGVRVIKEWVQQTTEAAVGFKHLAERLGTSTEAVQQLGYAADVTGADAETMQTAMQRMAMGMEHAKKGSGPLVDALIALHVPISEIRNKPLDAQLTRIAEGFKNAGPEVNKTAASMELFGRSAGPRLIPLMNKGAAGIRELREEFEATGAQIDGETIEQFEQLEIQQKKLGYVWKGLKNEAIAALLPALKGMAESVMKWVKANKELIKQSLEKIINGLAVALKVLASVFGTIVTVLGFLADHWKLTLVYLGALTVAFAVMKREAVVAALETAAAWVVALLPFILIAAGIAAIILIVQDLYVWMNGGDSAFKRLYEAAKKWFGETGFGKVVMAVVDGIKGAINFVIKQFERLINLGHNLGNWAAWEKQKSRAVQRIMYEEHGVDPKTGKTLTMDEINAKAEAEADREVEQSAKEADSGSDEMAARGSALLAKSKADPWNFTHPAAGANANTTNHNTMHAQITLQGLEAGEKNVGETVVKHLNNWWQDMSRHTQAATTSGARRP